MTEKQKINLGRHLTIEYSCCDCKILDDPKWLETIFINAAAESGATVVSSNFHQFNPIGVSGVVIIAESHFTVHTWPEYGYAAVDMFTCGDTIDFYKAIDILKTKLSAKETEISGDFNRGFLPENSKLKVLA